MKDEKSPGGGWGGEMLIPGLLNDITLEHISTKVSWRTFFVLVGVNRAWRRAIREREVYNVRKRTDSGQTLLAYSLSYNYRQQGLYDPEQQCMHLLPPLPPDLSTDRVDHKIGFGVQAVMLDGKLYILSDSSNSRQRNFSLDLGACSLTWKKCSATESPISTHLCVVYNEKLYAIDVSMKVVEGMEEWSPMEDGPRKVRDMNKYHGRVACLNNEIYFSSFGKKKIMMVFNCSSETWRVVKKTIPRNKSWSWVVIDEKLYNLSKSGVRVYDPSSNTWAMVQPIRFENYRHDRRIVPYSLITAPVPFSNEFLAFLQHKDSEVKFPDGSFRKLCRSVGFGVEGRPLVWEVLPYSNLQALLNKYGTSLLGSVQL